jgi:predicted  nucleic acid-binding Zn-ribbon protein
MPDGQKQIWITSVIAATMAVCIAAAVVLALNYWLLPNAQHNLDVRLAGFDARLTAFDAKLAALDTKIEKNHKDLLAAVHRLPSLDATTKKIETLNYSIKKANEALADIQRQISPAAMKASLVPLDDKLNKVNATLSSLKLDDAARNSALARVEKAIDAVRHEIADAASQAKLASATAKLDAARVSLAKIEKATDSLAKIEKDTDALRTNMTANASVLNDTRKSLAKLEIAVKDGFASGMAAHTELTTATVKSAQPPPAAPVKAAAILPPPIPTMSVQFERIGGFKDHGQVDLIIQKLRQDLKGRSGCAISVEGYTDTVGSDRFNHALSKKRALEIAAKLKSAFAGNPIQISTTAWGERRLKEWTKDNVADATNRRVDIVVRCSDE